MKISQLSEWMRIYQSIEKSLNSGNKLIQLVSCNTGEGTSTVTLGLAKSCADILGKTVVVLGPGLENVETKPIETNSTGAKPYPIPGILSVSGQNYFYLASSTLKNIDLDALGWREIVQHEQLAKSIFDLTLVESPALSISTTGLSIARHADAVILIVEAENTRWPELLAAKENIIKVGGNLLGVVLNKRRHYAPPWLSRFIFNRDIR